VARILVVDDEPTIRSLVRDVLEEEGHEVLARRGRLRRPAHDRQHRPTASCSTSCAGPGRPRGLQRVRASPARLRRPVVMLTRRRRTTPQAWQAWTEGVDYFLPKPFEPLELLRFLDTLFPARPASLAG
jgi:DNA-binding response OmpR family regulator